MRLVETCSCGASLELIWTEPSSEYSYGGKRESKRAVEELRAFRMAHSPCLPAQPAVETKEEE